MKLQAWATGSGPLALTISRQVEPLDVFHGQDEALAEPEGRIGGDDVGVVQLGGRADLAEEPVEDAGAADQVAADDLEHLLAPHERVLGQVDDAHAAAAQLAEDLVVRVVGQSRRQGARPGAAPAGRRRRPASTCRRARRRRARCESGLALGVAELAQEAVGGHLGDAASGSPGSDSRCWLTESADASSSLPRPYERRICSLGCMDGGAFIDGLRVRVE